jgi:hypothetical protein
MDTHIFACKHFHTLENIHATSMLQVHPPGCSSSMRFPIRHVYDLACCKHARYENAMSPCAMNVVATCLASTRSFTFDYAERATTSAHTTYAGDQALFLAIHRRHEKGDRVTLLLQLGGRLGPYLKFHTSTMMLTLCIAPTNAILHSDEYTQSSAEDHSSALPHLIVAITS